MRHNDELALIEEFAQDARESRRVGLIERGVHFIENAEGARLAPEDRQQQCDGRERLLAAGKERKRPQFLSWRPSGDLDAGFENVHAIFQDDIGLTAAEEFAEELLEVSANGREGFGEEFSTVDIDGIDNFFKRSARRVQVVVLFAKQLVFRFQSSEFLQGFHVHRAQSAPASA